MVIVAGADLEVAATDFGELDGGQDGGRNDKCDIGKADEEVDHGGDSPARRLEQVRYREVSADVWER